MRGERRGSRAGRACSTSCSHTNTHTRTLASATINWWPVEWLRCAVSARLCGAFSGSDFEVSRRRRPKPRAGYTQTNSQAQAALVWPRL
jgi:hypothetical protein